MSWELRRHGRLAAAMFSGGQQSRWRVASLMHLVKSEFAISLLRIYTLQYTRVCRCPCVQIFDPLE
jgi:hypothetical protein